MLTPFVLDSSLDYKVLTLGAEMLDRLAAQKEWKDGQEMIQHFAPGYSGVFEIVSTDGVNRSYVIAKAKEASVPAEAQPEVEVTEEDKKPRKTKR